MLIITVHSIMNTIGRTYASSYKINKLALPIRITYSRGSSIFNLIFAYDS